MISYLIHQSEHFEGDLQVIGEIPSGMPSFQVPPFSIPEIRNETTGEIIQSGESFMDIVSGMGSSLIVIPLIALLENISVCKAFGKLWSECTTFSRLLLMSVFLFHKSSFVILLLMFYK